MRRAGLVMLGSIIIALASLFGVEGGARAEWQVPLCAVALIYGTVAVAVTSVQLVTKLLRRAFAPRRTEF